MGGKTMANRPAYFVGPWDLNRDLPCVPSTPDEGTVVLVESVAKGKALPFHKQKLVLVLSAMHHFAAALEADGFTVEIVTASTYLEGIREHIRRYSSSEVRAMRPREYGIDKKFCKAEEDGIDGVSLRLFDDGGEGAHFLLTRAEFLDWARDRKQIRMHHFYSWMRKRTGYLMDGDIPIGGKYSFDSDNRQTPDDEKPPARPAHAPDDLTRSIMKRVAGWSGRWGSVDGFAWPVTREQALAELDDFFAKRATCFGPFQDAMVSGDPFLWHSRLSSSINLGLVHPREVADRIAAAHAAGDMPIASAEGLLRQIIGWREFIRGIYWLRMPDMREANGLNADRPLPAFFWDSSQTDMACMQDAIGAVEKTGYAHHIQRLMVLGNYALLAGIRPIEISHWFWAGFVDAYEWVELPNVHGMAVYADDTFTTKPYAASGNYITKMSNYCRGCHYSVSKRSGDKACPFNTLFWHFMHKHRERLSENPRLGVLYSSWDKKSDAARDEVLASAKEHLDKLPISANEWEFHDDDG